MIVKELLALAERVEAATTPDRALDAAIWLHLPEQGGHDWKCGGDRLAHAFKISGASFIPFYTRSLDAAMTLVPNGLWFEVEGRAKFGYSATVGNIASGEISSDEIVARTPALAVAAASLRARAAMTEAESDA